MNRFGPSWRLQVKETVFPQKIKPSCCSSSSTVVVVAVVVSSSSSSSSSSSRTAGQELVNVRQLMKLMEESRQYRESTSALEPAHRRSSKPILNGHKCWGHVGNSHTLFWSNHLVAFPAPTHPGKHLPVAFSLTHLLSLCELIQSGETSLHSRCFRG